MQQEPATTTAEDLDRADVNRTLALLAPFVRDGVTHHKLASVGGAHPDDVRRFLAGECTLTPAVRQRLRDWASVTTTELPRVPYEIPTFRAPEESARAVTHSAANTADSLIPPALAEIQASAPLTIAEEGWVHLSDRVWYTTDALNEAVRQMRLPAKAEPAPLATMQLDAPPCSTCGDIMVRNGSCYRCFSCGTTSGCS